MEPLRTVLFVDGRNFKYNLREFKFQSQADKEAGSERYYMLDEKHFLWQKFFLGVIEKFNNATQHNHRLVRAYWYNADTIRPFKVDERRLQSIVDTYSCEFKELDRDLVWKLAKGWYDRERELFYIAKEQVYEGIQRKTDFLEFKYTGEYVVNPFQVYRFEKDCNGSLIYHGTSKGEKGVDVGIAVDMVVKMPNYDVGILVSGDADFLPAVRFLKDCLKNVYQFSIAKGIPPRISYLSPWLIGVVDVFQSFDELELLGTYLNRKASIPPPILETIDRRIDYLKSQQ